MRTNGGCYCLKDLDFDKRMRTQGYIRHLESEVERLRETQRKFGTVQEELFQRAEKAEVVIKALVEAGDRLASAAEAFPLELADLCDGWAEAKRKAGV
jgi:hypothetical protein